MFKIHLLFIRKGSEEGSLFGFELYPGKVYINILFKEFQFKRPWSGY